LINCLGFLVITYAGILNQFYADFIPLKNSNRTCGLNSLQGLPNEDESVGIQIFAGLIFSGFWGCVCLGFRKIDWFCVFFVGRHLLLYPLLVCCCFLVDFVVD